MTTGTANINGVIRYIYNENGEMCAEYIYDAWGRVISAANLNGGTVAEINPFRYKSYYYDTETGFYYLQSRYYDPTIARFISADSVDYLGASGSVLSYNLFCYCENEPVQDSDPGGKSVIKAIGLQFSIAYGRGVIGLEVLWETNSWKTSCFLFIGGLSKNIKQKAADILYFKIEQGITKIGKLSLNSLALVSKLSISLSFVVVLGNKYSSFPYSYNGWFFGASFSIKHVSVGAAIGKTGKAVMAGVSLGITSSYLPSLKYSQTYYCQLEPNKDAYGLTKLLDPLKKGIYNTVAWVSLFAALFI